MEDLEERTTGVLLGLAAGDRIGGPVRMAVRVAESLLDRGGFDASDIGIRYLDWWRKGAFDTGPTVDHVLSLVASGMPFERAAIRVDRRTGGMTAGCNPAHRCAPLAMCPSIDDSELSRAAVTEARLTHRHPLAGDVAAAVACLCRALIRGASWPLAVDVAAAGRSSETRRALEISRPGKISRSGFGPEALGAAIHFVNGSTSFSAALARSIEFASPVNYCPVLVGCIGGARWGRSQIDERSFRHQGELVPRLTAAAVALASGWSGAQG